MPTKVRKVLYPSFGGPEVVQVIDAVLPDPVANHVQVKVLYSGFGGGDINMRRGTYPMQKKAPLTPGYCFVGRVHINGPSSSRFSIGDLVGCLSIYDGESTFTNQPEKFLVPVPEDLDPKVATALILDWNTAWGMVKDRDYRDKRVFVHGMSGAVGYGLLILCKAAGAEVYGTASVRNHEEIRKQGGMPFVYTNKDWIKKMNDIGGAKAVFDPLGFSSWDESYSILDPSGSILFGYGGSLQTLNDSEPRSVLWPTIKLLAQNLKFWSNKSTTFYYIDRTRPSFEGDLVHLFALAREKKIQVPVRRSYKLEDVPSAHREWKNLTGLGSMVVEVSQN